MPFFGELFGMREENDVVLVLTWRNLVNVKEMLGAVPFKDAVPSDMEQQSEHPKIIQNASCGQLFFRASAGARARRMRAIDPAEIFATITWGELLTLQTTLDDAHPIMLALLDLSERQRQFGINGRSPENLSRARHADARG